jgi:dipeptidyl aminopeptidase/acylaminoacyl peptidase
MSMRWAVPLLAAAFVTPVFAAAPAPGADDPRIATILKSLGEVHSIESVAVSPDGQHLAWVLRGKGKSTVQLADIDGSHVHGIGKAGDCRQSGAVWAPDSKRLAFLSDCGTTAPGAGEGKQTDVYVVDTAQADAAAKQLTHLHGYARGLNWTADGKQIGFLYVEGGTRRASATAAAKPAAGEVGVDGLEIQRVAAVDAVGGALRMLTPAALYAYEFSFSPDASQIAYTAAPAPGDNNWWIAKLYVQTARPEAAPAMIVDTGKVAGSLKGLQMALPRFSPDGKSIAFIGGLMSDQGSTGGDIYRVSAKGGSEPANLTAGSTVTPVWLTWTGENSMIVAEHVGGDSRVSAYRFDASGKAAQSTLFSVPASIADGTAAMGLSLSKATDTVAFIQSSYEVAPEVHVGKFATSGDNRVVAAPPAAVTRINAAFKPSWGKTESVEWENEGHKVQGWLLYPANYDASKKYPMIVSVHGGPASAVVPRWPGVGFGGVPFSTLGYFVFMPNPRGSYGRGEAFVQANRKDFGYGDLRDILKGVDAIEAKLPVDDKRLGLTGWSYGGFMTMFSVTQTTRFSAAVAGAGISNWQSYYGENLIDQWMTPFFGASVYDDPAVYAKSSAINFIKKVKTPTLVVVGDRDAECPAPQSFEFWHALRAQNVPTSLVVYPNEGHGFASEEHRRDVLQRALKWFQTHLPPTTT